MNGTCVVIALAIAFLQTAAARAGLPTDPTGFQADVGMASKYQYNVYYDDLRAVNDEVFDVAPEFHAKSKPHFFSFQADGQGLYEQYATQTIQDHIDGQGRLEMDVNESGKTLLSVYATDNNFSDPSPTETFGRIPRNQFEGGAGIKFKGSRGNSLTVSGKYSMESFLIPNLSQTGYDATHLYDNNEIDGTIEYESQFLPETSWFLRGSGGQKIYPNQLVLPEATFLVDKNGSVFGLVEAGFVGRLSERTTLDCAAGLLYRDYTVSAISLAQSPASFSNFDTFFAPVFYAHFAEQLTRRDQFTLGYDYKVEDSYYTNYYLDQEIYAGLVRVLGDQVLALARLGYDYRSYSLPFRRDDIRITASFSARYSITKTIKATADLKIDLLSSDAYDNSPAPISPDRPLTYNAGSFTLGLVASY